MKGQGILKLLLSVRLTHFSVYFLIHLIVLFLVYKLFYLNNISSHIHSISLFKQWDGNWYEKIAKEGYNYSADEQSNVGFFPLFPYLWRYLHLDVGGVVFLNFAAFFTGLYILVKNFNISPLRQLFYCSAPSFFFMYCAYTESLFFLFSSLILCGLKKENNKLILTGLLLASLTRPTAIFFIPAIIITEILHGNVKSKGLLFKRVLLYSLMPMAGIIIVILLQYMETGVWFAYFKAQSVFWKREFQWPEIPFTTWDGARMLWLDGLALFFGVISFIMIAAIAYKKIAKSKSITTREFVFSLMYLFMAILSVIFFNNKDETGGTSLMGANRYLIGTAFFVIAMEYIFKIVKIKSKSSMIILISLFSTLMLLGLHKDLRSYTAGNSYFYFILLSVFILLQFSPVREIKNKFTLMVYLLNCGVQVFILDKFINGIWIG